MSKGSHRRTEDVKKVRDNWDLIFGKKEEKQDKPKETTENKKTK